MKTSWLVRSFLLPINLSNYKSLPVLVVLSFQELMCFWYTIALRTRSQDLQLTKRVENPGICMRRCVWGSRSAGANLNNRESSSQGRHENTRTVADQTTHVMVQASAEWGHKQLNSKSHSSAKPSRAEKIGSVDGWLQNLGIVDAERHWQIRWSGDQNCGTESGLCVGNL